MIRYGFFNAKRLITGAYDRKYNADDVNRYFKGAISRDGVYQFVGNQCKVIQNSGMNVTILDGKGQLDYHWFEIASNETMSINPSHATLNRYTAIVARYDSVNRNIYLATVDGVAGEYPIKPVMQRTETIREICLAFIYVRAGSTAIAPEDIINAVEDEDACGFVKTLLDSTASGVVRIPELPLPSAGCQGKIYYLSANYTIGSKTYEKGFYFCEPGRYTYDFKEVAYVSDVFTNRPEASEEYLQIMFYATDTNAWYRCKSSDSGYIWESTTVTTAATLPTPSASTYDKLYLHDSKLYIGTREGLDWDWIKLSDGAEILVEVNALKTRMTSAEGSITSINNSITTINNNLNNKIAKNTNVKDFQYMSGGSLPASPVATTVYLCKEV